MTSLHPRSERFLVSIFCYNLNDCKFPEDEKPSPVGFLLDCIMCIFSGLAKYEYIHSVYHLVNRNLQYYIVSTHHPTYLLIRIIISRTKKKSNNILPHPQICALPSPFEPPQRPPCQSSRFHPSHCISITTHPSNPNTPPSPIPHPPIPHSPPTPPLPTQPSNPYTSPSTPPPPPTSLPIPPSPTPSPTHPIPSHPYQETHQTTKPQTHKI